MTLGPVSSENEGASSGTGRVRAFSLVIRACWCWRGGVVSAVRARGLPSGWPYLLQDVRVCLLEVVEGLEEASLDAGHVLLCEVGVVLGGGVGARPQQRHESGLPPCTGIVVGWWGVGGRVPCGSGGLPSAGGAA